MTIQVEVPGSKSMTQRALIIGAMAGRPVTIAGALDGDDSRALTGILRELGVDVGWNGSRVSVTPAPFRSSGKRLDCGNGGTTIRFVAGLSLITEGPLILDGNSRMRERTIRGLGCALRALGVDVEYLEKEGYPPVRLQAGGVEPREVPVDGSDSSQFISSLLLVSPRLEHGLRLLLVAPPVSKPYLDMTMRMMTCAGANVAWSDERTIVVDHGQYYEGGENPTIEIEPDWSAAAFFIAAGAIVGTDVLVPGLLSPQLSLQGDSAFSWFVDELRQNRPHRFDLTDVPDLIAPLAAAALFASAPTEIVGASHTRIKESDRIDVLSKELVKLGARIDEREDGLLIHPPTNVPHGSVTLDPADDHRMAMAFGIISLRLPDVKILNAHCVSKSFPNFWEVLSSFRSAAGIASGKRGN